MYRCVIKPEIASKVATYCKYTCFLIGKRQDKSDLLC